MSDSLQWELACKWYGTYTREQFQALSGDDQARIVALYLVSMQMEAVLAKAQADEMRQQNG